jgi:outer membrane usher protein
MAGLFSATGGRSGSLRRVLLGTVVACSFAGAARAAGAAGDEVLYLQPIINGQAVDGILPVTVTPQGLKIPAAALGKVGLRSDIGADAGGGARLFGPSGAVRITIDNAAQTAVIRLPGADILPHAQVLAMNRPAYQAAQTAVGGYASYNLTLTRPIAAPAGPGTGGAVQLAGGVGFVVFSPAGEVLAQTNIDAPAARFATQPPVARLSTTYELDMPDVPAAWRVGDVITASPGWARDDLAGGVQYATDDALQPDRVTFPAPQIGGTLADPSAVSLLVNNARAYNTNLAAGPFSLVGVPVITGLNEITVQTRAADGQISSTTVPFYASSTMLQAGLAKYSGTLGYLRQDYGTLRDGYRIAALDATYSEGLTNALTATVHTEDSTALQLAGLSLETANVLGDLTASVAGSRRGRQQGGLVSLQFARSASLFSLGGGVTYAGPGYADLTAENGLAFPRLDWYASAGAALPWELGSLHVGYTDETYGRPDAGLPDHGAAGGSRFLLASYTKQIFGDWSFDVSLSLGSYGSGGRTTQSRGIDAAFSLPLGGDRRGQVSFADGTAETPQYGEGASALPNQAQGWGWAAQNQSGRYTQRDADLQANTLDGDVDAQFTQFDGQSAAQLSARGSVALLDGVHASAPIDSAFAVFDVGYPNIPVFLDNRAEGKTNAAGRTFLPGLLPYYPNQISVSPTALPLTANFQSNAVTVVPPLYGGVVATLPVSRLTGVLIRITLADGQYPPAGAVLTLAGRAAPVVIGYDGEALVADAPARLEGTVTYAKGRCTVSAALTVSLQNYLVAVPVSCALGK